MRGLYNDVKPLEGKAEQQKETDALVPSLSHWIKPSLKYTVTLDL